MRKLALDAQIDGTVFESFSQFTELEELLLQESPDLDVGLSKLPNLSSLKRLDLIRLAGNGHSFFSERDFSSLEHLELWECDIDDHTVLLLSSIKSLRHIEIMYSNVTEASVLIFNELPKLESLIVANVPSENLAYWLEGLPNVRNLTVNNVQLISEGAITNEGMECLRHKNVD